MKYNLLLYHNNVFIGKYISINHLLVMSDYTPRLRDRLKKDFNGIIPEEYIDIRQGIKIIKEDLPIIPRGRKAKKKLIEQDI